MGQRPVAFIAAAPLLAFLWAAPVSAAEPAGGAPGEAELNYEVYAGGLHVLTFDLDLKIATQSYDLTARYGSTGFFGWLIPWTSVSVATEAVAVTVNSAGTLGSAATR